MNRGREERRNGGTEGRGEINTKRFHRGRARRFLLSFAMLSDSNILRGDPGYPVWPTGIFDRSLNNRSKAGGVVHVLSSIQHPASLCLKQLCMISTHSSVSPSLRPPVPPFLLPPSRPLVDRNSIKEKGRKV